MSFSRRGVAKEPALLLQVVNEYILGRITDIDLPAEYDIGGSVSSHGLFNAVRERRRRNALLPAESCSTGKSNSREQPSEEHGDVGYEF